MHVFLLTSRKMSLHIHTDLIALLALTRSSLWKRLNLVTSYCHKNCLSANDTKQNEPGLAGVL